MCLAPIPNIFLAIDLIAPVGPASAEASGPCASLRASRAARQDRCAILILEALVARRSCRITFLALSILVCFTSFEVSVVIRMHILCVQLGINQHYCHALASPITLYGN